MDQKATYQYSFNQNHNSERKIIHIDMDCFYAAVEMRDNPQYRNRPLAVGGKSKRSVLCTANYEARKFGVKAALPSAMAIKMCPQLIIVSPNFKKYKEASEIIQNIFREFTDLIQPLSLDEAYLDVTYFSNFHDVSAYEIAKIIKQKILLKTNLTASAGIAKNKFLAKIASDWKKPNGIFEIKSEDIESFLSTLDVKFLPGVGPVTREKLERHKITNCQELKEKGQNTLIHHFGKFGKRLFELSLGIDDSIVKNSQISKSLSIENTFKNDLDQEQLILEIPQLVDEFCRRFIKKKKYLKKSKSLFVKIKLPNHEKKSLEKSIKLIPQLDNYFEHLDTEYITDKLFKECSDHLSPIFSNMAKDIMSKHNSNIRLFGLGVRYQDNDLSLIDNLKYFDQLNFDF